MYYIISCLTRYIITKSFASITNIFARLLPDTLFLDTQKQATLDDYTNKSNKSSHSEPLTISRGEYTEIIISPSPILRWLEIR